MSSSWQQLAISQAKAQSCLLDIVLATVEAETSGTNITGDSGNALGFGQVWPKWHMDVFREQARRLGLTLPSDMDGLTALVLKNEQYSMAVAVGVIKQEWENARGDWRKFTLAYVGSNIPSSDYNRREKIWNKYNGNSSAISSIVTTSNESLVTNPNGVSQIPETNFTTGQVVSSGQVLYGRRYRILVSTGGGSALDVSQLKCTFNVQKTMLMQPNMSEITIFNLSADTENTIIKEGMRVVIEAGYEGDQYGVIFDGDVVQPIRDKEDGTTYKLTLTALDGDRFMNFGFVNFALNRGQTARKAIEQCTNKAKFPSQLGSISTTLKDAQLTRGKVVFGLAKDYLSQIAKGEKATFYVEDGKVNIVKASDTPTGQIIELSPSSGLIGVPAQNEYGMTGKCLLNPRIKPNTLIHIDNSLIKARRAEMGQIFRTLDNDGIYRVIKVNHIGDTRGDDWYTEFETITQAGYLPGMVSNTGMNPW